MNKLEEPTEEIKPKSPEEVQQHAINTAKGLNKMMIEHMANKSGDDRYKFICENFGNFARAYPIVVKYIAFNQCFFVAAFKKFFKRITTNPGKGMEGYMENQAYYAKYLYEESCKMNGKRIIAHEANKIFSEELRGMTKNMKDIQKKEKDAKSEYEEIEKENNIKRRLELIEFAKQVALSEEQ